MNILLLLYIYLLLYILIKKMNFEIKKNKKTYRTHALIKERTNFEI